MKIKQAILVLAGIFVGLLLSGPSKIAAESIKSVIITNFPSLQNVHVTNFPQVQEVSFNTNDVIPVKATQSAQLWDYWYQCHPNPTNEAEIRGYLNDRGNQGWEVVAAAGPGNLICEYYKKPKSN